MPIGYPVTDIHSSRRKIMKKLVGLFGVLVLTAFLVSCDFIMGIIDPISLLYGTWVIDVDASTGYGDLPVPDTYHKLILDRETQVYTIISVEEDVIERGELRNVDKDSFESTLLFYNGADVYDGSRSYAEWKVSGDNLTVSFYADARKEELYITLVCRAL
jgi:hypothetical protein